MNKSYFIAFLYLLPCLVFSAPVVNEQYNLYKINGSTSSDLRKELSAHGPVINGEHFDAQVNWYINWYYYWNNQPQHRSCKITRVEIKVKIDHSMPHWDNEEAASSNLQLKWNNYLKNLTIHEQGHADNGLKAAQEIEQALLDTPAMLNCVSLKKLLDDRAYAIIKKHNDWDSNYDEKTHHGRTQGATFP